MTRPRAVSCGAVDELAAALALGALDPDEERAVRGHLATCWRSHGDAHSLIDASVVVPASLEPVEPSEHLRARLMATIAETPQAHRPPTPVESTRSPASEPRRPWWAMSFVPSAMAAVALAAAIGLGAWGITLNQQLTDRDTALSAVASADAVHPVTGEAGSALLIEIDDSAFFVAEHLADLPPDRLYHFWLLDADGNALPAGTLAETGAVLVPLERGLAGTRTFAVTLERARLEAPTSAPILVSDLGA
ncbi:MAG: anti-sigma factor [Chloroflexota bacterium]|nr:anti-sigma factor [Chloroflexota bacterium]